MRTYQQRTVRRNQDSWLKQAEEQDDDGTEATYCGSDSDSDDDLSVRSEDPSTQFYWKKWQATFRSSTENLLSDYVDPRAELHMKLPGASPPAEMPPFSFYCQKKKRDICDNEFEALDYSSDYPVLKQEQPRRTKAAQEQRQSVDRTRFLLHRFARC